MAAPEVYKSPNSDCYIVFGEAKVRNSCMESKFESNRVSSQVEDMNSHAQLSAAQQLASSAANPTTIESSAAGTTVDDDEPPELKEVEDDGPVDETGVDPKDIDLVMQQVNCSRAKAVRALRDSGGDLINASECLYPFVTIHANGSL